MIYKHSFKNNQITVNTTVNRPPLTDGDCSRLSSSHKTSSGCFSFFFFFLLLIEWITSKFCKVQFWKKNVIKHLMNQKSVSPNKWVLRSKPSPTLGAHTKSPRKVKAAVSPSRQHHHVSTFASTIASTIASPQSPRLAFPAASAASKQGRRGLHLYLPAPTATAFYYFFLDFIYLLIFWDYS